MNVLSQVNFKIRYTMTSIKQKNILENNDNAPNGAKHQTDEKGSESEHERIARKQDKHTYHFNKWCNFLYQF